MTAEQFDAALAELLRLGLVEKVRDQEGVERYSTVEMEYQRKPATHQPTNPESLAKSIADSSR